MPIEHHELHLWAFVPSIGTCLSSSEDIEKKIVAKATKTAYVPKSSGVYNLATIGALIIGNSIARAVPLTKIACAFVNGAKSMWKFFLECSSPILIFKI